MTCTTEVRMTKAYDSGISMLIARTIFIYLSLITSIYIMRNRVGFRAKLHDTKWSTSARKRMSHSACANHRIYVSRQLLAVNSRHRCRTKREEGY